MSLFRCSREQELGDTSTVVSVDGSVPDGTATDRSFSGRCTVTKTYTGLGYCSQDASLRLRKSSAFIYTLERILLICHALILQL